MAQRMTQNVSEVSHLDAAARDCERKKNCVTRIKGGYQMQALNIETDKRQLFM